MGVCTEPVRADFAALRIGSALCLLADIAINYAPGPGRLFPQGQPRNPAVF